MAPAYEDRCLTAGYTANASRFSLRPGARYQVPRTEAGVDSPGGPVYLGRCRRVCYHLTLPQSLESHESPGISPDRHALSRPLHIQDSGAGKRRIGIALDEWGV